MSNRLTAYHHIDVILPREDRTVSALVLAADRDAALAAIQAAGTPECRDPQDGSRRALRADDIRPAMWPEDREAATEQVKYLCWALGFDMDGPEWMPLTELEGALAAHTQAEIEAQTDS